MKMTNTIRGAGGALVAVGLMAGGSVASAGVLNSMYLDASAAGAGNFDNVAPPFGDADSLTRVFNEMQFFANTSTTQFDTDNDGEFSVGDRFRDTGNANIQSPIPGGDFEGINVGFGNGVLQELTLGWNELDGTTTAITPIAGGGGAFTTTVSYDSVNNSVFSFYLDNDVDGDFGSSVSSSDDTGFGDGVRVLDLQITGGSGNNEFDSAGQFVSGSSLFDGEVTFALDGFWNFAGPDDAVGGGDDVDFNDVLGASVPIALKSMIDQNTNNASTDFSGAGTAGPAGFGDKLFTVNSDHDGSISFSVPEPGSLALFGLGLFGLGLGTMRRRR